MDAEKVSESVRPGNRFGCSGSSRFLLCWRGGSRLSISTADEHSCVVFSSVFVVIISGGHVSLYSQGSGVLTYSAGAQWFRGVRSFSSRGLHCLGQSQCILRDCSSSLVGFLMLNDNVFSSKKPNLTSVPLIVIFCFPPSLIVTSSTVTSLCLREWELIRHYV